jgi:hypothetical protein
VSEKFKRLLKLWAAFMASGFIIGHYLAFASGHVWGSVDFVAVVSITMMVTIFIALGWALALGDSK